MTLTGRFNTAYTYYDKDHIPKGSPVSGSWHREGKPNPNCDNMGFLRVEIPYQNKDAITFDHVDLYYDTGFSHDNTYFLVKYNRTGDLVLSITADKPYYYHNLWLYDGNNQRINDINKLNTLVKLSDEKLWGDKDTQCNFIKSK